MESRLLSYEWVHPENSRTADTVVMVHGILGQKRNLFGFARRFVKKFPRYKVLLVDLRNHGSSQGFDGPHTLGACAKDLTELFDALQVAATSVIGHSFGAAVALTYARQFASYLSSLWLLDAVPALSRNVPRIIDPQLEKILDALEHCSAVQSGQEIKTCLLKQGISESI